MGDVNNALICNINFGQAYCLYLFKSQLVIQHKYVS